MACEPDTFSHFKGPGASRCPIRRRRRGSGQTLGNATMAVTPNEIVRKVTDSHMLCELRGATAMRFNAFWLYKRVAQSALADVCTRTLVLQRTA